MHEISYNGNDQRKAVIVTQQAAGLQMLHDDYAFGWRRGEEPRGVMTWGVPQSTPPEPEPMELIADELHAAAEEMRNGRSEGAAERIDHVAEIARAIARGV